jgi:hypothetical protein
MGVSVWRRYKLLRRGCGTLTVNVGRGTGRGGWRSSGGERGCGFVLEFVVKSQRELLCFERCVILERESSLAGEEDSGLDEMTRDHSGD